MNRNPEQSHCDSRPRSMKTVFQVWEESQDEAAISAEEVLSEMVAAEAEKAEELRWMRMAAVGPYVMPEVRRAIRRLLDKRQQSRAIRAFNFACTQQSRE